MLTLLGRRARAQWPLLAALLGVVAVGATLLGACALLVTRTAGQAVEAAAARAAPAEMEVTAYVVGVAARDARPVAGDARGVLTSALAPFPTTTTTRAASVTRKLPRPHSDAYLSGVDDLPAAARLVTGRWPRAGATPVEAVVLEPTARRLGLAAGGRVHLGAEQTRDPAPAMDVTVVGVVRPLVAAGWDRDPLGAAGFREGEPDTTYGPFVVDLADLLAGGSALEQMEITARPDLSSPARRDLDAVTAAVLGADRRLAQVLGDRVRVERVGSPLPATLLAAHDQQRVTAATVLAVAVLGIVLTAIALTLAGRLTASVRGDETALLSALGFSRGRLAAAAALEAAALAALGALLAVPASTALHAGLTHLPPLSGALPPAAPAVTGVQVLAVACAATALAALLTVLAVLDRRPRRLARSGADLLLVVLAAAGWWQLHAQPTGSGARADAVRVVAPALLLAAGAALALRLAPPALRAADRLAGRARGLVLPLAAFEAARRPQAVAAGLLIGLACATGTFGIAFDATWQRSQHDQADLSVGTDLALTLDAAPTAGQGATVEAATGGQVSPAVDRGIAVGQWLGAAGAAPRLVAVDTSRADALLRGRLDGDRRWADVGAALAPATAAGGTAVPAGATLTLTGTATGGIPLSVTPRLLLQDATGLRTPCVFPPVPLDGRPHPLPGCAPSGGLRLVAVSLPVAVPEGLTAPASRVDVTLTVPGALPAGSWTATSAPPSPGRLGNPAVEVAAGGLRMTTTVDLAGPPDAARDLVATAFPAPGPVPVAVSARFAGEVGARPGAELSLTVGDTPVPVRVVAVVPSVPSAPGEAAVLADVDALSRALVVRGDLDLPLDAWWVGRPTRGGADALHLGAVTTRAAEAARLAGGPVRAGLPAALRLLVPAAAVLLLAGLVLQVTFDLRARALELARLRGFGMSRRQIRAVLLGQHAGVLLPLLAAGAAVGALATRLVAPLLVRSDTGAAPVPEAVTGWPWAAEAGLLAALLGGCLAAVAVVVVVQTRRADAAHLRVAS